MFFKFSHRSTETELLDASDLPKALLFKNLHELDIINRSLGGHVVTLNGMKQLLADQTKTYVIADLGCGGGDALRYMAKWTRKNGYRVQLIGVDVNADAITYLNEHCRDFP